MTDEKKWKKIIFKSLPALIEKSNGTKHLFREQKYDKKYFKLDKEGWTHEHCDECFERIEVNYIYYVNEGEINCESCYEKKKSYT